jgi:hypothetical protein
MSILKKAIKPSEIKTNTRFKALIYGTAGVGKSYFACQFPSPLMVDTENGVKSPHKDNLDKAGGDYIFLNTYSELHLLLTELLSTQHQYKTLIIDPFTVIYQDLVFFFKDKFAKDNVKSGYSKEYTEAQQRVRLLFRLIDRLDMNVIITMQGKADFEDKTQLTFDAYNVLSFMVDLALAVKKDNTGKRIAVVTKDRDACFKGETVVPFEYSEIVSRIGIENLTKEVDVQEFASEEEIHQLNHLLEVLKVDDKTKNDWYLKSKSTSFSDMPRHFVLKIITYLQEKLNAAPRAVSNM